MLLNMFSLCVLLGTTLAAAHDRTPIRQLHHQKREYLVSKVSSIGSRMKHALQFPSASPDSPFVTGQNKEPKTADTAGYLIFTLYEDACNSEPVLYFGLNNNFCEKLSYDDDMWKSTNYGCTSNGTHVIATTYFYEDKSCAGTPTAAYEWIASSNCDSNETITCSDSSAPWTEQGLGTLGFLFPDNTCDSDEVEYYYMLPNQCSSFNDGSSFSTTCTDRGIEYAYYDSSDTCSSAYDATFTEKHSKCKNEMFFDDDGDDDQFDDDYYYYYDDNVTADDDTYYAYSYYYDDDTFMPSHEVTCCTYDEAVCTKSMNQKPDEKNVCFGALEQVMTPAGQKAISEVSVGESVLTMTAEGSFVFSEVVFIPHAANTKAAQFINIVTPHSSLRATKGHLLPVSTCGQNKFSLRSIDDVSIGDCVLTTDGEAPVIQSDATLGYGVYTVVTKELNGHIVVNGIVASSFGTNHVVANTYYHLYRMIYSLAPTMMASSWMMHMTNMLGNLAISFM